MNVGKMICAVLTAGIVAGCSEPTQPVYYPVSRTSMPGGYSLVAIQQPAVKDACEAANARYVAPMKACAECKVEYSGCDASLAGVEKALVAGEPVAQYSLSAGPLRMLINGPDQVSKVVCEQMVGDLGKKGTTASCVAPGTKR